MPELKTLKPQQVAFLESLRSTLGLAWLGDWYVTVSLKTARDLGRPGSSTERGWGTVVINDYGWELYHVHAGEIANGSWEPDPDREEAGS